MDYDCSCWGGVIMYEIKNNFLNGEDFQKLSQHMQSPNMTWSYQPETTKGAGDEPFFSHIFYQDMKPCSYLYDQAIHHILTQMGAGLVYNVRGNLYYGTGKQEKSSRHIDVELSLIHI